MFRALVFFTILGAAVWGAVSLSDHPGSVSLQWGGYRVDPSLDMWDAFIFEAPNNIGYCIHFSDIPKKLIAQTFPLRCASY